MNKKEKNLQSEIQIQRCWDTIISYDRYFFKWEKSWSTTFEETPFLTKIVYHVIVGLFNFMFHENGKKKYKRDSLIMVIRLTTLSWYIIHFNLSTWTFIYLPWTRLMVYRDSVFLIYFIRMEIKEVNISKLLNKNCCESRK